jgi:hypothetical protein
MSNKNLDMAAIFEALSKATTRVRVQVWGKMKRTRKPTKRKVIRVKPRVVRKRL